VWWFDFLDEVKRVLINLQLEHVDMENQMEEVLEGIYQKTVVTWR